MMMTAVAMCVGGGFTLLLPRARTWTQWFILSQTVVVYNLPTILGYSLGMQEEMWRFVVMGNLLSFGKGLLETRLNWL